MGTVIGCQIKKKPREKFWTQGKKNMNFIVLILLNQ